MSNTPKQVLQVLRTAFLWTPILMFHEVLPDGTNPLPPYAVTQSGLRTILEYFTRRGYTPGSLADALEDRPITGQRRKQLVLTFDDGTRDFVEYGVPVLQEFGCKATLFIVAGMVGGNRDWQALPGQPPLSPVPLLDAAEVRALHSEGYSIGSHTLTHCVLPSIQEEQAWRELVTSRQVLGDMIGEAPSWFAYPYLAASAEIRALVRKAGYVGACGGPHQRHDRYYLNRIDASSYTLAQLKLRTNGIFHMTRQIVREARYGTRVSTASAS